MPSLANYWIATSFKDYLVENKHRLEKKYIVPLNFQHIMPYCRYTFGIFIWDLGYGFSIMDGGVHLSCSCLNLSWYGFGWGKTPWYVALLGMIFTMLCGGLFSLYAFNTQLRFNNQDPVTFYQMYMLTLMHNTLKYEFYRISLQKNGLSLGLTGHLLQNPFTNFNVHWF